MINFNVQNNLYKSYIEVKSKSVHWQTLAVKNDKVKCDKTPPQSQTKSKATKNITEYKRQIWFVFPILHLGLNFV